MCMSVCVSVGVLQGGGVSLHRQRREQTGRSGCGGRYFLSHHVCMYVCVQAFLATNILDNLTVVLSASIQPNPTASAPAGDAERAGSGWRSSPWSEHTKEWAKMAMDALIGKTFA